MASIRRLRSDVEDEEFEVELNDCKKRLKSIHIDYSQPDTEGVHHVYITPVVDGFYDDTILNANTDYELFDSEPSTEQDDSSISSSSIIPYCPPLNASNYKLWVHPSLRKDLYAFLHSRQSVKEVFNGNTYEVEESDHEDDSLKPKVTSKFPVSLRLSKKVHMLADSELQDAFIHSCPELNVKFVSNPPNSTSSKRCMVVEEVSDDVMFDMDVIRDGRVSMDRSKNEDFIKCEGMDLDSPTVLKKGVEVEDIEFD